MAASNPYRGETSIDLGGETRLIRYTLNKLVLIQEKIGAVSLEDMTIRLTTAVGLQHLRFILWIGLARWNEETQSWEGPSETEVGEWEIDLESALEIVGEALQRSFRGGKPSEDESGKEDESPLAQAGDGKQAAVL